LTARHHAGILEMNAKASVNDAAPSIKGHRPEAPATTIPTPKRKKKKKRETITENDKRQPQA